MAAGAELSAPSTAALRFTRIVVEIEDAEEIAVGFLYFVGLHAWIIDGQIGVLRESDAIQLIGSHKHAVAHIVNGQIGLDVVLIEVVFGLAEFLSIVPPIPTFEFDIGTFSICDGLHFGEFFLGELLGRVEDVDEELVDSL